MVCDMTSPEENVFIEIRVFDFIDGLTLELPAETFEGSFEGISFAYEPMELNGFQGDKVVYTLSLEGTPIDLAAF